MSYSQACRDREYILRCPGDFVLPDGGAAASLNHEADRIRIRTPSFRLSVHLDIDELSVNERNSCATTDRIGVSHAPVAARAVRSDRERRACVFIRITEDRRMRRLWAVQDRCNGRERECRVLDDRR